MTWLLKYRRHLIALAIVAAVAGSLAWWGHTRYRAGVRDEQARAERVRHADKARTDAITQESGHAWNVNLEALNARVTTLLAVPDVPAIRVCSTAPQVRVPTAPAGTDDAAEGAGPDLRVGPDIGGRALVLAAECERDRRRLTALQAWVNEVLSP